MTTIDEAFEDVRTTLIYLDHFRTIDDGPPADRDGALSSLDLIRERMDELEGTLGELQRSRPDGDATVIGSAAHYWLTTVVPLAALSTPSKEIE